MSKFIILLTISSFFLSLNACNKYDCNGDFITDQGICVYKNNFSISQENVNTIIDYTIDQYAKTFEINKEKINDKLADHNIDLIFTSDFSKWYDALGATEITYNKKNIFRGNSFSLIQIFIWYDPTTMDKCLANSSLVHETLHAIESLLKGANWTIKNGEAHTPEIYDNDQLCDSTDEFLISQCGD
jgi:hypothetical protein